VRRPWFGSAGGQVVRCEVVARCTSDVGEATRAEGASMGVVMSGYLMCDECLVMLPLGSVVWSSRYAGRISHFASRLLADDRSGVDRQLSRAVWKMLADHTGHVLRV
jgi:hypothetical protein